MTSVEKYRIAMRGYRDGAGLRATLKVLPDGEAQRIYSEAHRRGREDRVAFGRECSARFNHTPVHLVVQEQQRDATSSGPVPQPDGCSLEDL